MAVACVCDAAAEQDQLKFVFLLMLQQCIDQIELAIVGL